MRNTPWFASGIMNTSYFASGMKDNDGFKHWRLGYPLGLERIYPNAKMFSMVYIDRVL